MARDQPILNLAETLSQEALRLGLLASGAVDISLAFQSGEIQKHIERFDHWLSRGFSGDMSYLMRGRDRRADPRLVFPEAQSIFLVLDGYHAAPAGEPDPERGARYARYLRGRDYHLSLTEKLEVLMKRVCATSDLGDLKYKICVDTSAILERSWAALAGLGWIGKNTMLIHPKFGSYTFIGAVLLNRATGIGPTLSPDLCGHCTKCLEDCPTGALAEPHLLDPHRCISYLTLEKRGNWSVPDSVSSKMGSWVAGCDLCQEACPFNQKASKSAPSAIPDPTFSLDQWSDLLEETDAAYQKRVAFASLNRVKPKDFKRNVEAAFSRSVSQKTLTRKSLWDCDPREEKSK